MKRVFLLMVAASVLFLTGCQKNESVVPQSDSVVQGDPDTKTFIPVGDDIYILEELKHSVGDIAGFPLELDVWVSRFGNIFDVKIDYRYAYGVDVNGVYKRDAYTSSDNTEMLYMQNQFTRETWVRFYDRKCSFRIPRLYDPQYKYTDVSFTISMDVKDKDKTTKLELSDVVFTPVR